jgi:hypothetical protein
MWFYQRFVPDSRNSLRNRLWDLSVRSSFDYWRLSSERAPCVEALGLTPISKALLLLNMFSGQRAQQGCNFSQESDLSSQTIHHLWVHCFFYGSIEPRKLICTILDDGTSLIAPIVDFFPDSSPGSQSNVGLSLPGFTKFAPESDGIVVNVTWTIV